jgi:DNA-binding transcriptional LysR family regulator
VHDVFEANGVTLNIDLEMPTVETVKKMIRSKMGISFLPRICVREELANRSLIEVGVREFTGTRSVVLVFPAKRDLSHAATAFTSLVKTAIEQTEQKTGNRPAVSAKSSVGRDTGKRIADSLGHAGVADSGSR